MVRHVGFVFAGMTRSNSDRIEKLEADQSTMRDKLDETCEKLDAHGTQLADIATSLAALTAMFAGESATEQRSQGATEEDSSPTGDGHGKGAESAAGSALRGEVGEIRGVSPATFVTLPASSGDDPIGWVARVEQQFEIHGIVPGQKVAAAVVAMEEDALYWVSWLRARKPTMAWDEFAHALVARFDTRFHENRF